jgi:hypothetical protein
MVRVLPNHLITLPLRSKCESVCVLNRIYKLEKRTFKCDSRDYFIKTRGLKLKGTIKVKTIDNHT